MVRPDVLPSRFHRSWLLPVALGALGATLRLWQYGVGASLWADEANLALNIIDRPLGRLLGPLDYRQMAPPGWLVLQKAAVTLLGDGEYALRLIPLLGSLATLPLVWHVASRLLRPTTGPALALGLVATAVPLIFFAAQVKPYATDAAVGLGLLALALAAGRGGGAGRPLLALGFLGALAPWFSYPALLVDAGLLAALVASALLEQDRARVRALVPLGVAWAVSAVGAITWARGTLTAEDVGYLRQFWAPWLMPVPPRSFRDLGWPATRLTTVFGGGGLRYPAPGVLVALAAIGTFTLWRRDRAGVWLLLGPIVATFAASALQVYPFSPRLVLFLFPVFLILTAAGPEALTGIGRWGSARATAFATLLCAGLALYGLVRDAPPYAPEPLKPALVSMRQAWQPGDRAYVYYGAEKAFVYYARRFGFPPGSYILGRCAREDPRVYLRELDALRGAPRAWVVIAHGTGEDQLLVGYLDRIGTRRASFRAGGRAPGPRTDEYALAYLFDLSDPQRLAAASWDTFPVAPRRSTAAWSCHPGA